MSEINQFHTPATNTTKIADLIVPEVLAPFIERKIEAKLVFAPIAVIDRTLQGKPGDTITYPQWTYIGDAEKVTELGAIPIAKLGQTKTTATIAKVGKGVEFSDEADIIGLGNILDEATSQIAEAIATKINKDCLETLLTGGDTTNMVYTTSASGKIDAGDIANMLVKFKEEIDVPTVMYISPETYGQIRLLPGWETVQQGAKWISGQVGRLMGVDFVVTNSLIGKAKCVVVRPGCLGMPLKRDFILEKDRDIIHKSTILTADKYYGTYVKDKTKLLVVTIKA